jgi:hypothetical protein
MVYNVSYKNSSGFYTLIFGLLLTFIKLINFGLSTKAAIIFIHCCAIGLILSVAFQLICICVTLMFLDTVHLNYSNFWLFQLLF